MDCEWPQRPVLTASCVLLTTIGLPPGTARSSSPRMKETPTAVTHGGRFPTGAPGPPPRRTLPDASRRRYTRASVRARVLHQRG